MIVPRKAGGDDGLIACECGPEAISGLRLRVHDPRHAGPGAIRAAVAVEGPAAVRGARRPHPHVRSVVRERVAEEVPRGAVVREETAVNRPRLILHVEGQAVGRPGGVVRPWSADEHAVLHLLNRTTEAGTFTQAVGHHGLRLRPAVVACAERNDCAALVLRRRHEQVIPRDDQSARKAGVRADRFAPEHRGFLPLAVLLLKDVHGARGEGVALHHGDRGRRAHEELVVTQNDAPSEVRGAVGGTEPRSLRPSVGSGTKDVRGIRRGGAHNQVLTGGIDG